jgi:O-antigen ligase
MKDANWHRTAVICMALVLPWINPFTSSPSTNVIPLLLSWMMTACVVLSVIDMPAVIRPVGVWAWVKLASWLAVLAALVLLVPRVVDRAMTLGLASALVCIALMAFVGRRLGGELGYEPASSPRNPWVSGGWTIETVALAWLIAACVNAVIGVLQYLDLAAMLTPWVNIPFYKGDAFGNLRQRNQFATLMSIGWVALWWWVMARSADFGRVWARWVLAGVTSLLATGVAISISRTGLLEWVLLIGLSLAWCWARHKRGRVIDRVVWWFIAGSGIAFVAASVVMPYIALGVTGTQGASMILRVAGGAADYQMCGGRGVLWSNVLTMLSQHPWLGWGWAQTDYAHFMTTYTGTRFCDMLDNAHDLPLHVAVEFGMPFALVSVGLGAVWIAVRRPWAESSPTRLLGWGVLLVLGVHSLLEYPLWYGPFQMALGLAIGLVWEKAPLTADAPPEVKQPAGVLFLACALFVGALYAAWDFNRVSQIYKSPAARDPLYSSDPMGAAKQSWLFQNQAEFAWLTTQEVTKDNAEQMYEVAQRLMSYSPEDRVVSRLISSAKLLSKDDEASVLQTQLDAMRRSMQGQKK